MPPIDLNVTAGSGCSITSTKKNLSLKLNFPKQKIKFFKSLKLNYPLHYYCEKKLHDFFHFFQAPNKMDEFHIN